MGMTRLLVATDDLLLDCPDAVRLLSLFLGRAIVDEILPPSFLTQVRVLRFFKLVDGHKSYTTLCTCN